MRFPLFILFPVVATLQAAHAQDTGDADLICLSVGDETTQTLVAVYGADATVLTLAIPPQGADALAESIQRTMPPDVFATLEAAMVSGLADLPAPPTAEACGDDPFGAVVFSVRYSDGPALIYEAPCADQAARDLNDALIAATGDPMGLRAHAWQGPVIPALRDICRFDQ